MKKYMVIAAAAALALGAGSVASANGTVEHKPAKKVHKPVHKARPAQTCAPVCAPVCSPAPAMRSGFFGGIKGGYGFGKGKLHSLARGSAAAGVSVEAPSKTDFGVDGGLIGLALGYDWHFRNKMVLGIEGGASWANLKGNNNSGGATFGGIRGVVQNTSLKAREVFDLSVRIGRVFHQSFLGYGKVGAEWTKWKLSTRTDLLDGNGNAIPAASTHKYRTAWLLGLGFEVPVTAHFSMGAEYTYSYYNKISASKTGAAPGLVSAKVRPYSNKLLARLIWKQ